MHKVPQMNRRSIRCFVKFFTFEDSVTKVYYQPWERKALQICVNCRELFFIDWDNPKLLNVSENDVAKNKNCPRCNSVLGSSLKRYPDTFYYENGIEAHFEPTGEIPPDNESLLSALAEEGIAYLRSLSRLIFY